MTLGIMPLITVTLGIMSLITATLGIMSLFTVTLGLMALSAPDLVVIFSIRELHNGIFYISFLFK
jgi:hypothetical protein